MARFNYAPLKTTAAKLIDRFGTDGIIRRINDQDYAVRVVISDYLPREKDGQFIQFTDRKAIIAAKGLAIVPNAQSDSLIVGGVTLQIVLVTPTSPGGDDVIYDLQIRR